MRDYYITRIRNIFTYTDKRAHYVIFKTLCIIIGAPLFFVLLPVDLLVYFIYALFSWIPVLSTFFLVVCKALSYVCSVGYYIALLPDAKKYIMIYKAKLQAEKAEILETEEATYEQTEHKE
jgi:hypothetical protein